MNKPVVGRIVNKTLELFTVESTYNHYNLIRKNEFGPDKYYIYSDKTGYLYKINTQKYFISEEIFKEILKDPTAYTLDSISLFFWSDSPIVKAITENDNNKMQEYITMYNRFLDIKKNHYRITRERNTKKMCGEKISFKEKWMYFKYNLYYNFRTKNLGRKMRIIW